MPHLLTIKQMSIVDTIGEFRQAVTVMGLGPRRGIASARFLQRPGRSAVTDLRGPETLEPAMRQLEGFQVRYVLLPPRRGFAGADIVIKNPAVATRLAFSKLAGA